MLTSIAGRRSPVAPDEELVTWADTPGDERRAALVGLAAGNVNVVFCVDLFNEAVDVPGGGHPAPPPPHR